MIFSSERILKFVIAAIAVSFLSSGHVSSYPDLLDKQPISVLAPKS